MMLSRLKIQGYIKPLIKTTKIIRSNRVKVPIDILKWNSNNYIPKIQKRKEKAMKGTKTEGQT